MAVVYRARDERLGRLVALKVLAPALAADEEFRRRFTAESRAAAAVDHPHIIPVYEADEADRALFIAMRLVTGGDLRGVLAREGPLPPERAARFLSPVASALDAAHAAGLVHRDVKPANVLVDRQPGGPEHVYLSDFGISTDSASAAGLTRAGRFLGTPEYTAPEQVKGHSVDGRADQYALACVAWHLLTGTVPFARDQGLAVLFAHLHEPAPPLDGVRPDLPAAAGQVLARALAKEPGERYASCGEFAEALREALALPPYRPGVPASAGPAAAGHQGAAASALAALPAIGPAADEPAGGIAAPGARPGGHPARPARRRRYLTITLAGTFLAAATAVSLLLATSGAAKPPAGPHAGASAGVPAASVKKPQSAAPAASTAASSAPVAGTRIATLADVGGKGVRALAFGPGGLLAAGDANGRIYLWHTATGKPAGFLVDPASDGVDAVAFGPGGLLAAADANGSAYLWDTATGKVATTVTDPASKGVSSVAFSPGGTLATGDENGRIYLWNTATGQLADYGIYSANHGVSSMAFGTMVGFGSDKILASCIGNGTVALLDTNTIGEISTSKKRVISPGGVTAPGSKDLNAVAFGPADLDALAAGDANGRTYLWDTADEMLMTTVTDPASKGVTAVAFSPGGTLVTGDANGRTYLWGNIAAVPAPVPATGTLLGYLSDPASKGVTAVAFSPGGTLVTGDANGRIYLWHVSGHGS